jgi:hypothetical protein
MTPQLRHRPGERREAGSVTFEDLAIVKVVGELSITFFFFSERIERCVWFFIIQLHSSNNSVYFY